MARTAKKQTHWIETTDPLSSITRQEWISLFNSARRGNFARLHWVYAEMEAQSVELGTCLDRRQAALSAMGWRVSASSARPELQDLADRQREALTARLERITNLSAVIEHLDLAFFRGLAVVPVPTADGDALLPDTWRFCRSLGGRWYFNPDSVLDDPTAFDDGLAAGGTTGGLVPFDASEAIVLTVSRPIDYAVFAPFLRERTGADLWGRDLERTHLPNVYITQPPRHEGAADENDLYLETAEALRNGGIATGPNGSGVVYGPDSQGATTFMDFLATQQKQIVLRATGGTLTSLAESGSGTLAGNAQMDVWRQIVARDAVLIGEAIDRAVARPFLEAEFPGEPVLAHFCVGGEEVADPDVELERAAKAKAAGFTVDAAELSEAIGRKLEKDEAPAGMPGMGGFGFNAKNAVSEDDAARPGGLGPSEEDGFSAGTRTGPGPAILAFCKDNAKLAARIQALLDAGDDELPALLADLLDDLPDLMPDGDGLADAMRDALCKAFAEGAEDGEDVRNAEEDEEEREIIYSLVEDVENFDEDKHPRGQPGNKGQFAPGGGAAGDEIPETSTEKRHRTCKEALEKFNATSDHPSVEDVLSGKETIREALKKGFSATFGGHKLVFFTEQKTLSKYEDPSSTHESYGRIDRIPEMLKRRGRMFPQDHKGDQIAIVERPHGNGVSGKRFVVVADKSTSVVTSIMQCDDRYIKRNFKK